MTRYEKLREILGQRKYFKLVCGAGNEDADEVRRLTTIYALGGATAFDVSANVDVVRAARKGIEIAYTTAPTLGKEIKTRPYINVSIGLKGDPHVRKAQIQSKFCTSCGACRKVCKQEAITESFVVKDYRCIGCGDCEKVCSVSAIEYIHKKADFYHILPQCEREGAETMELHAVTLDDEGTLEDWKLLNKIITHNYISMCLDRSLLSDKHLVKRVKQAYEITGERSMIQADGFPMSGEGDDYNTTLQAVACADIVRKSGIPVMILLSGGTNSKTGLLAKQCGVVANGVAIGSWARKIVKEFIKREDFDSNLDILKKAVVRAEELIQPNIEAISG